MWVEGRERERVRESETERAGERGVREREKKEGVRDG